MSPPAANTTSKLILLPFSPLPTKGYDPRIAVISDFW